MKKLSFLKKIRNYLVANPIFFEREYTRVLTSSIIKEDASIFHLYGGETTPLKNLLQTPLILSITRHETLQI